MISQEMSALEKGFALYRQYCEISGNSDKARACLQNAYNEMLPYIDEIKDFYDRLIFANIVQDMQDLGGFDVTEAAVDAKIKLYDTVYESMSHFEAYQMYLWSAITSLAKLYLKNGQNRDDAKAKRCYEMAGMIGYPIAEVILKSFIADGDGTVRFIGKRPE